MGKEIRIETRKLTTDIVPKPKFVNTSSNRIPEQKKGKMCGTTTTWILAAVCCLIAVQAASAGESNEQYVTLKKHCHYD